MTNARVPWSLPRFRIESFFSRAVRLSDVLGGHGCQSEGGVGGHLTAKRVQVVSGVSEVVAAFCTTLAAIYGNHDDRASRLDKQCLRSRSWVSGRRMVCPAATTVPVRDSVGHLATSDRSLVNNGNPSFSTSTRTHSVRCVTFQVHSRLLRPHGRCGSDCDLSAS
jgi:hypothetical protein